MPKAERVISQNLNEPFDDFTRWTTCLKSAYSVLVPNLPLVLLTNLLGIAPKITQHSPGELKDKIIS